MSLVGQVLERMARMLWQEILGAGMVKTVTGVLSSWTWPLCPGPQPEPVSPLDSLAPVIGAVECVRGSQH